MTGSLPRTLLTVCCLLLALVRMAHAEDASERAARRHFERGQKLFALQKFDDALEQYQKAYDADPLPAFLYNIGQCHRNLGDLDSAIFSFKRYLKLEPDADNREQVEELIDDLERKKAEGDTERLGLGKRKRTSDDEPRETPEGTPVYKKWYFWTAIAVVGVGAGVGIYYATRSNSSGPPMTDFGNIDYPK